MDSIDIYNGRFTELTMYGQLRMMDARRTWLNDTTVNQLLPPVVPVSYSGDGCHGPSKQTHAEYVP